MVYTYTYIRTQRCVRHMPITKKYTHTHNQSAHNQPADNQPTNNQPTSQFKASSQPASSQPANSQAASSQPGCHLEARYTNRLLECVQTQMVFTPLQTVIPRCEWVHNLTIRGRFPPRIPWAVGEYGTAGLQG